MTPSAILSWIKQIWAVMVLACALLVTFPVPAQAQSRVSIDIPASRLSDALRLLNKQANITVVGSSKGLSSIHTRAVRGNMSAVEALRRLLANTPYRARQINRRTFRIERRKSRVKKKRTKPPPAPARRKPTVAAPPPPAPPVPIIVTATKRRSTLAEYPGGVQVISLDEISVGEAADGMEKILLKLPVTNSTALGSGRNKIFVRGIADSSFNGPTQSTIGLYLGEQRVIYSASNPDLRLYDMERIELLEGPQGTLYGAGAIGGVIRMVPGVPNSDGAESAIWASAMATQGGAPGYDVAAMANLPISGTEALRGVVYKGQSGGYIDDERRGLENINETQFLGGRLAFRSQLSADWSLDLTGFGQKTDARDAQYIDARLTGLWQSNSLAQPFGSRILGVNAALMGQIGEIRLVSSTGILDHDLDTRYESSALAGPMMAQQAYDETRKVQLISHETRISNGSSNRLSWVIGVSAMQHDDDYRQLITNTNGDNPPPFANIAYKVQEYALFGEASHALGGGLSATLGGRLAHTKGKTRRSFGVTNTVEPETDATGFLPMAALSLAISDEVTSYIRYQQGYRTAGITVERLENGDPQVARFDADKVQSVETGIKGRLDGAAPVTFSLAAFYMKWRDVQADLIDPRGFTITRNTGNAEIYGLSMQSDTELTADLNLLSSFFLNHSEAVRQSPAGDPISAMLPNIAPYNARVALRYRYGLNNGSDLIASGRLQYTGRSVLDVNLRERISQGNFAHADLSLIWRWPSWEIGLEAENIANTRGNRFSFGNPFTIRREDQQTPLRPFSVRLSGKISF